MSESDELSELDSEELSKLDFKEIKDNEPEDSDTESAT
jgi:hypothetical protein